MAYSVKSLLVTWMYNLYNVLTPKMELIYCVGEEKYHMQYEY